MATGSITSKRVQTDFDAASDDLSIALVIINDTVEIAQRRTATCGRIAEMRAAVMCINKAISHLEMFAGGCDD